MLASAPRTLIGYHGCTRTAAERILVARQFLASENAYDWLGKGIYFWEYAPYRALEWAKASALLQNDQPAVIRASIRPGFGINLLDTRHIPGLAQVYQELTQALFSLPVNSAQGAHFLDRLVMDTFCQFYQERYKRQIQTVRGCFPEGTPIFAGSRILSKTHVQIAVRDPSCILQMRLVPLSQMENRE